MRDRCFTVLLDVESTQQHDGFLAEDAPYGWVWRIDAGVSVDGQDTSSAAEAIVGTSVVAASKSANAHVRFQLVLGPLTLLGCRTGAEPMRT